jgi:catechol 2,3-dioxygenase-like lactoylglutathione lyase family enzyme
MNDKPSTYDRTARLHTLISLLKALSSVCAVLVGATQIPTASAQVPGFRGIDHIGLTVPNLEEAVDFFVNVIGCEDFFSNKAGPFDNDWMWENLDVDPNASLTNRRVRCGNGANLELFDYQSPDQRTVQPKNSDYGGHHFAFYVDDIDAAVAYLRGKGLKVLGDIKRDDAGPTKGFAWVYVLAPWGTQLEFVSYPNGLAYEQTTKQRLWNPRSCEVLPSTSSCQ